MTMYGQRGMWHYRIWQSGWCELWGAFRPTGTAMQQDNNVWYMPSQTPPAYPATFDVAPVVTVSAGDHNMWVANAGGPGDVDTPPSMYLYADGGGNPTAGAVITIYYHVAGYVTNWIDGGGKL